MKVGLRLRDCPSPQFDLMDLFDLVVNCDQSSALFRAINPAMDPLKTSDAQWNLANHLLAQVADLLAAGNWQRGGGKGRQPKPIPRPGVGPQEKKVAGNKPLTMSETMTWFKNKFKQ